MAIRTWIHIYKIGGFRVQPEEMPKSFLVTYKALLKHLGA